MSCGKLDPKIRCAPSVLQKLDSETLDLCNSVLPAVTVDDPGLVVQFLNPDDLHAALALPGSPIPPGADPLFSMNAFRAWVIQSALQAPHVGPGNHVPSATLSTAFRHLTEEMANAIVYKSWHLIPWAHQIQQAGLTDRVALVLWLAGTGKGRADMFVPGQVFG
eukprot:CAMPEP_0196660172 /NCGR_PEP_ID=MMETSP1086-20130531/38465_1 /TAXON_ID=77921 /ORGANISM="Cyanoptyche  gloeocystis , Strain SAG4.97" /LENGTH=163 /DNA_ID=CAMNT_0041994459 /DNA_START=61 /DNA_END=552 /DNA_ORIENTATION=+